MKKVLILGGYGNFGTRISTSLARLNIPIIIAGRDQHKAIALQNNLTQQHPLSSIEIAIFDFEKELATQLNILNPAVVINTAGPFQLRDYSAAETCIEHQVHYIDLADGRAYANGITCLNQKAKAHQVLVVSGASTVPGLSSAVLEHFKDQFSTIDSVRYGINPGQKTPRGLATVKSILSYLGRPIKPYKGADKTLYGWQDLYLQEYPELGKRWMANCEIPDLDIFAERYNIKSLRFSAGMESSLLHLSMWLISYLIRCGLPIDLTKHAEKLLQISHLFDRFGTTDGGMHMIIEGLDKAGNPKEIKWFIIGKAGDGPQIPCVPTIILAKDLIVAKIKLRGAFPCVGLITLNEYMDELTGLSIKQIVI